MQSGASAKRKRGWPERSPHYLGGEIARGQASFHLTRVFVFVHTALTVYTKGESLHCAEYRDSAPQAGHAIPTPYSQSFCVGRRYY